MRITVLVYYVALYSANPYIESSMGFHVSPKHPSTAYSRTLVPNTITGIVFGTRVLKWAVDGPLGPRSHQNHRIQGLQVSKYYRL